MKSGAMGAYAGRKGRFAAMDQGSAPEDTPSKEPAPPEAELHVARPVTEVVTFELPQDLAEELRGATAIAGVRMASPDGEGEGVITSMRELLHWMVENRLQALQEEYNGGQPFPRVPRSRRRR